MISHIRRMHRTHLLASYLIPYLHSSCATLWAAFIVANQPGAPLGITSHQHMDKSATDPRPRPLVHTQCIRIAMIVHKVRHWLFAPHTFICGPHVHMVTPYASHAACVLSLAAIQTHGPSSITTLLVALPALPIASRLCAPPFHVACPASCTPTAAAATPASSAR